MKLVKISKISNTKEKRGSIPRKKQQKKKLAKNKKISYFSPAMRRYIKTEIEIEIPLNEDECDYRTAYVEGVIVTDRGSRDHYGVPMEPDYQDMEDICAFDEDGGEIELDGKDLQRAEEALWEAAKYQD